MVKCSVDYLKWFYSHTIRFSGSLKCVTTCLCEISTTHFSIHAIDLQFSHL